ncbi:MAG: hypothetical protein Q7S28_02095 [bacterium]|nr:hypothetical protein [bacterium]
MKKRKILPEQVIVVFRSNVSANDRMRIVHEMKLAISEKIEKDGLYILRVEPGTELEWSKKLEVLPEVKLATPNYELDPGN